MINIDKLFNTLMDLNIDNILKSFGYISKEEYYRYVAECDNLTELLEEQSKSMDVISITLNNVRAKYIQSEALLLETTNNTNETIKSLREELWSLKMEDSGTDKYLKSKYKEIPMIAYTGKRKYDGKDITLYLNEMITPNTYEVQDFFEGITSPDLITKVKLAGNRVARYNAWTSDKVTTGYSDYYTYPNELIIGSEGDCEDHSFLLSSFDKEIGVAYGYLTQGKRKFGHAFNVFEYNNTLYVVDTTGNTVHIEKYDDKSHYYIHFIIMHEKAYMLDNSVTFGVLRK